MANDTSTVELDKAKERAQKSAQLRTITDIMHRSKD